MVKKILFSIGCIAILSACSSKLNQLDKDVVIDNSNTIIGKKENAINKLTYNEIAADGNNVKFTFYVDQYPYYKKFNLCENNPTFKTIKSVTTNNKGEDFINYDEKTLNCNSYIYISSFQNNEIKGDFEFNFLSGYNTAKVKGYDTKLETMAKRKMTINLGKLSMDKNYLNNTETKIFWNIE